MGRVAATEPSFGSRAHEEVGVGKDDWSKDYDRKKKNRKVSAGPSLGIESR